MTKKLTALEFAIPSPAHGAVAAAATGNKAEDERKLFAAITKETPRDKEAETAFLTAKVHTAATHPTLDLTARAAAAASVTGGIKGAAALQPTGPIPGGVGYGMFYN